MSITYIPRNDFILYRVREKQVGSLIMPQISQQGKEFIVVATGPDVKDLKAGDRILPMGELGMDIAAVPNENDLRVTKQYNVILVIIEEKEVV